MRGRNRRRTIGSRHSETSCDGRDLPPAERAASLEWAREQGYTRPSIQDVRKEPFGTICLMADGDECQGLVIVQGLDVVIGVDAPTAAILFHEASGPPPWGAQTLRP